MGLIFLISVFLVSVLVIQGDLFFFQNFQITRKSAITHVYAGRLIAIVLLFLLFTNLKISKTVELIIISLLSVALSNTAYRIAILGVIISFITYHLISITKSKKINLRSAHIVFIVSIVISLSISENFKERIPKNEIEELKNDISVIARLEAWKEAVKLWEKNKFVGAGFGSFYSVDENLSPWRKLIYPHNIFLEILAETGIIGLIIFLIGILYSFIETLKSKPFYLGFLIFLFTLSLTSKDITINFVVLIFPYIISSTSSILKDYI